jgi:glycerol-3-phosphate cytidylyltransferase-like family protein|tara:strand:- start:209 stop:385 length:177 start_codon:yes stop_codon:yes gene_type:complete
MSREFVDAVASGNNIEAEKVFTHSMASKVGDALEVKRKELSNTFVNSVSKDTEEKDEV